MIFKVSGEFDRMWNLSYEIAVRKEYFLCIAVKTDAFEEEYVEDGIYSEVLKSLTNFSNATVGKCLFKESIFLSHSDESSKY